jgi:hypothetical protein
MELAKQRVNGEAAMLQATLRFTHAVRGSGRVEVSRMRRQAKLAVEGFCAPCARALEPSRA